jgi:hypothetical protein
MTHHLSWVLALGIMSSLPSGLAIPTQDPAVKQLATDRYNAAKTVWERLAGESWDSLSDCDARATWSRRLAEAASESGALSAREAFTQHLARMQEILTKTKVLYEAGRRTAAGVAGLDYHVAEAKGLVPR